jgi:hypothetical protein
MNDKRSICAVLIAILALAIPGRSQDSSAPREGPPPIRIIFMGGLGAGTVKAAAADRMRTGKGGFLFDLGVGAQFFNIVDIGIGAGMLWLADHDEFTNSTTGGERSSSVWPLFYYAQTGLQVPVPIRNRGGDFPVWLAFHVGSMGVSVNRSISSCTNCDVEKLSMKGAKFYYRPEVRLQIARGVHMGLAYTFFCDCSDFKNMITLTFSGSLKD